MRCKICDKDEIFEESYCTDCWNENSNTIWEDELVDNPDLETEYLVYYKLLEEEGEKDVY